MTPVLNFRKILIPLLVLFLVNGILLIAVDRFTRNQIAKNARTAELRVIDSVMPLAHDNDLYNDYVEIDDLSDNGMHKVNVFRARQNGQPAGAVFMPVIAAGYSGKIHLVIGIAWDGVLLGVRVFEHRETPGLGDRIEPAKSPWINMFSGRSLAEPPAAEWAVQADGGKFDQLSGATITSRGVVNAVRQTLEYYQANRDRLYLQQR